MGVTDIGTASDRISYGGQSDGAWPGAIVQPVQTVVPGRGPDRLPSALQALAGLMGAAVIDLLYRSAGSDLVERLSSSTGEEAFDHVATLPEEEDGAPYVSVGQSVWMTPSGDGTTLLFVKLYERRAGSAWAAIRFDDGIGARRRLKATLPSFVTLLLSHATVMTALEEAQHRARAAMAALNQHDCGTFIVNADHSLLFANTAGQEMLDQKLGFHLRRGKLRLLSYGDGVRFETALDFVMDAERQGRGARAGMAQLLHVVGYERPMFIGIVPVEQGRGGLDAGPHVNRATAMVYATLPGAGSERGLDVVCGIHGLSPVETQLVCHLVAGLTIAEAAVEMHVKVDTARAYLKQVFLKTSTNRQSSLVRLVTRYQRALRGDFNFTSI